MFTMLVRRTGARIAATDTIAERPRAFPPLRRGKPGIRADQRGGGGPPADGPTRRRPGDCGGFRARHRGAGDACSRPGARILLFAQTSETERIEVSGADICVGERSLFGCYSASVDLQKESADLVFGGELPVEELISHRVPLVKIRSGFDLALHPGPKSLKIIVQPQRWT
jgi:L-iditol 2-dehydrogenase